MTIVGPFPVYQDVILVSLVKPSNQNILLQSGSGLVLIITIALGWMIRLSVTSLLLLILYFPLLVITIGHIVVQIWAILNIPKMRPSYISFMLISNLLFFLGFALQVDGGSDTKSQLLIAVFFQRNIFNQETSNYAFSNYPKLLDLFMIISIISLIQLIASWFFLLGKFFLNQQTGD